MSSLSAVSWQGKLSLYDDDDDDDDDIRVVLDQHPYLDFYYASSLKQQSLHLGTRFPHSKTTARLLLLNAVCLSELQLIPMLLSCLTRHGLTPSICRKFESSTLTLHHCCGPQTTECFT